MVIVRNMSVGLMKIMLMILSITHMHTMHMNAQAADIFLKAFLSMHITKDIINCGIHCQVPNLITAAADILLIE